MAWERRGTKRFFYLSTRSGQRVRKLYLGSGPVAQLGAAEVELRRAEAQAVRLRWQAEMAEVEAAEALARRHEILSRLLADAVLLACGFHRQGRHQWRAWRHGRKH